MTMQTDDKPRLVRVTDPVEIEAVAKGCAGDLSCPRGISYLDYGNGYDSRQEVWYADADELAKWRAVNNTPADPTTAV